MGRVKGRVKEDALELLANFELEQRKKEGDEEGFEKLSNYWLKFKINQVEEEWKAGKFN